MFLALVFLKF